MKLSILGAGRIGRALKVLLTMNRKLDFEITLYDQIPDDDVLAFDIADDSTIQSMLANSDYVVNAIPCYDPKIVTNLVQQCVDAKVHYLDFSEDLTVGSAIAEIETESLLAPHCGLAPGLINMIGNALGERFDKTESIQMYVGALTDHVNNRIRYVNTWSARGVVNEYVKDSEIIKKGKLEKVSCFVRKLFEDNKLVGNGLQSLTLHGKPYEAFYTSGGSSTMNQTWLGRAETVEYRSLRYPGHSEAMGELIMHRANLVKEIEKTRPLCCVNDCVIIYASASGTANETYGNVEQHLVIKPKMGISAIERSTCSGMMAVLELHVSSKLPSSYIRQEQVDWVDVLETQSLQDLDFEH